MSVLLRIESVKKILSKYTPIFGKNTVFFEIHQKNTEKRGKICARVFPCMPYGTGKYGPEWLSAFNEARRKISGRGCHVHRLLHR